MTPPMFLGKFVSSPVIDYRKGSIEKSVVDDITKENPHRWVILPIQYENFWKAYKRYEAAFWTPADIDAQKVDAELKDSSLRGVVISLCAEYSIYKFSLDLDAFVRDKADPICEILDDVQLPEARSFLGFISSFECMTVEMSTNVLSAMVSPSEAASLQEGIKKSEICAKRASLMHAYGARAMWKDSGVEPTLAERLMYGVTSRVVESIPYRYIHEIGGSDMPALCTFLRKMISTLDEHSTLLLSLYLSLKEPCPPDIVNLLVDDVVDTEIKYMDTVFNSNGLNVSNLRSSLQPALTGYVKNLFVGNFQATTVYVGDAQIVCPARDVTIDEKMPMGDKQKVLIDKGDENVQPSFSINEEF